jgi:hypothetical protein
MANPAWQCIAFCGTVLVGGCKASRSNSTTTNTTSPTTTATNLMSTDGGVDDGGQRKTEMPDHLYEAELKKLNAADRPIYSGPTGTISGRVFVTGAEPEIVHTKFADCTEADGFYRGSYRQKTRDGRRVLADAVIGITGYTDFVAPKRRYVDVRMDKCKFERRTISIVLGQSIRFSNSEARSSNRYYSPVTERDKLAVMRIAAPSSEPVAITPTSVGLDRIKDYALPFMTADLVVGMTPVSAVSNEDGQYAIEHVPVGKLTVHAFHPTFMDKKLREVTKEIEVKANETVSLDITLEAPAKASKKGK